MVKANGYPARFIFISPPSPDDIVSRLENVGNLAEDKIQEAKERAIADVEHSKNVEDFYDAIITNDDLDKAYESLEKFIYGTSTKTNGVDRGNASTGEDETMKDAPSGEINPSEGN